MPSLHGSIPLFLPRGSVVDESNRLHLRPRHDAFVHQSTVDATVLAQQRNGHGLLRWLLGVPGSTTTGGRVLLGLSGIRTKRRAVFRVASLRWHRTSLRFLDEAAESAVATGKTFAIVANSNLIVSLFRSSQLVRLWEQPPRFTW